MPIYLANSPPGAGVRPAFGRLTTHIAVSAILVVPGFVAASTDTFVYDKVSRIKEARQYVGGVLKTQSYAFDTFGNLSSITTNGSPRTLAVDGLTNRISGSGYDAAGSMTSWGDGGTTYSYAYYPTNEMKQMVGDGRTTLFGYSADGERVGSYDSVAGGITYVLRGLDNKPLRQYRESGGVWSWEKDWIYRDGLVLATVEPAPTGTKYFHLDHLGTPRRITNSSRAVIASHDYYPFGEEITASSQDSEALKFTGHERDLRDPTKTTDDLDYMHARYYNPWIGRFLSTDPIGGTPEVQQSWNRYSYVQNNPVRMTDPTGKTFWDVLDIGFFAASIGNLWKKTLTGQQITAADNLQVAGDAVGMLPIVPAIGTAGRLAKEGVEHGADVLKAADNLSDAASRARRLPFADSERLTEVNRTLDRIEAGGPFPHGKDGSAFRNREGRLPEGNYREYTVDTPGATDRGTRRVVVDVDSGRTYSTDDHYQNFVQIDPNRY